MRKTHRDLGVRHDGIELVTDIYALTRTFSSDERFGLTSQLRRAAVSVSSNIAEGAARGSRQEFARFVGIVRGFVAEVETQIETAIRLQ